VNVIPQAPVKKHINGVVRGIYKGMTHLLVIQEHHVRQPSRLKTAEVLAEAEKGGVVFSGHLEDVPRAHVRGVDFEGGETMKEIADLHLLDHVIVVIDGFPIQTETDHNTRLEHVKSRGDAVSHPEVARRMVGHSSAGFGEKLNILFRGPDAVSNHHSAAEKTNVTHMLDERLAQELQAIDLLKYGLNRMNMDG
jgi:hypothetical protein